MIDFYKPGKCAFPPLYGHAQADPIRHMVIATGDSGKQWFVDYGPPRAYGAPKLDGLARRVTTWRAIEIELETLAQV